MTTSGRDNGGVSRTVHDGLFKSVFSDPSLAAEELRAVLPHALVASIDWPTITPMPSDFIDAAFRQRIGDLAYHARFHGSGEVLLWLLEHQRTEDWWMLQRILETKNVMLRAALGPHVLSYSFVLDDLCAVTDEALRSRRMDAYARLCLFAMARAASRDFLDRIRAWQVELRIAFSAGNAERITSFMLYTYRVHRHTAPRSSTSASRPWSARNTRTPC